MSWRMALVLLLVIPATGWPCATVDPGALRTVVAQEEAVIVFDAKQQLEHFIRAADFRPAGESFGFIVPTPTPPTFGEVDPALFGQLAEGYEKLRSDEHRLEAGMWFVLTLRKGASPGVQVLSQDRVAGMDVVVLKATEGEALAGWLTTHGFTLRPAVKAWLDGYVEKGFVFSAFRYSGRQGSTVAPQAVRITFSTPVPVYPYLEPEDAHRLSGLRVWLIAAEGRDWVESSDSPGQPEVRLRSAKLQVPPVVHGLLAGPKVVTLFEDDRARRPATDVRFEPSSAAEVLPLPRITPITVPIDLLFCLGVCGLLGLGVVRFTRRRTRT